MKMENLCPDVAAIFCGVVNLRNELKEYGEKLEASLNEGEQTSSYVIAEGAVILLESAVKSLYFDEYQRYLQNKTEED